jgi:hypothetical protein
MMPDLGMVAEPILHAGERQPLEIAADDIKRLPSGADSPGRSKWLIDKPLVPSGAPVLEAGIDTDARRPAVDEIADHHHGGGSRQRQGHQPIDPWRLSRAAAAPRPSSKGLPQNSSIIASSLNSRGGFNGRARIAFRTRTDFHASAACFRLALKP